jgi:hypothetical protein
MTRCEQCQAAVGDGGEIDHTVAEWTRSATAKADRRPLGAEDGQLLCARCHKDKSRKEAAERKRADRAARGKRQARNPFKGWRDFKGKPVWANGRKAKKGRA